MAAPQPRPSKLGFGFMLPSKVAGANYEEVDDDEGYADPSDLRRNITTRTEQEELYSEPQATPMGPPTISVVRTNSREMMFASPVRDVLPMELQEDVGYAEPQLLRSAQLEDDAEYAFPQAEEIGFNQHIRRSSVAGLGRTNSMGSLSKGSLGNSIGRQKSATTLRNLPSFEPPSFDDIKNKSGDGSFLGPGMPVRKNSSSTSSIGGMQKQVSVSELVSSPSHSGRSAAAGTPPSRVQKLPFYWKDTNKVKLERLLGQQSCGSFLIRKSSVATKYALTGMTAKYGIRHYVFQEKMHHGQMSIFAEINRTNQVFASVYEMIDKFNFEHVIGLDKPLNYNPKLID